MNLEHEAIWLALAIVMVIFGVLGSYALKGKKRGKVASDSERT